MTTPRVTVPVEPTERLAQYVKGPSPYRAWRGAPPEGEPTLKGDIAAMLSAAPAPEGGAGDDDYDLGKRDGYEEAVQDIDLLTGGDGEYVFATNGGGCPDPEAMKSRIADRFAALATRSDDKPEGGAVLDAQAVTLDWRKVETTALEEWRAEFGDYVALVVLGHDNVWSYRVNNSGHLGYASAIEAKAQALSALRKRLSARLNDARTTVALYDAALATREEAPAEAGEIAHWMTDLLGDDQNGGFIRNLCYTVWQAGRFGHNGTPGDWANDTLPTVQEGAKMVQAKVEGLLALRAQPQAREDAQPVAWRAKLGRHDSWVHVTYDPTGQSGWHSAQPLYTHPAPDALRVAVEAIIERVKTGAHGSPVQALGALSDIEQIALAALQARDPA